MKKLLSILFLIAGIIITAVCGFYAVGLIFGFISQDVKKVHSIGIIGGADGPTAIFITSKLGIFPIAAVVVGIAIIVFSAISIKKNKNK